MLEAYKVAIRISLVEGVTSGLGLISRHLRRTDEDAKGLQKRLDSIAKMGAISAGLAGAGALGLKLFKGPLEEAKKYSTVVEQFKEFGLGAAALADAEKFVAANKVIGTSQRQMLSLFVEAQGVFRESGANSVAKQLEAAKLAAPMLAQMNYAMRVQSGHEMAENTQKDLLRFVEQAGGLRSPQRFNSLLDAGFKAVQSSGGNVSFPLYRQFMSYAGTAGMSLTDRSLFADFEPLIGELKSRAGVGLRTAANRLNGVVKLPNQVAHELVRMGVWDGSNIEWNNQGGIKSFIPNARDRTGNPLRDSALLGSSPVDFYLKDILPRYNAMHLTQAQRYLQNSKIFGGTGGQLFSNIDRFTPQIMLSRIAFGKALGVKQAVASASKNVTGKEVDLYAQEADLKLKIGKDIMPLYVHGLELVEKALKGINSLPDGVVKLGVYAVATGTGLALTASMLTGLATGAKALDAALEAGGSSFRVLPIVGRGLGLLGTGIRGLALALFANPIGLALLGIAGAALLIYNNWEEISASLKGIWTDIKDSVTKLFHGDILGALYSWGHAVAAGFQVLFNTVIAGVNSILPAALQISKFHFADPTQPKPNVVPPGRPQVTVHVHNKLDAKGLTTKVTETQALWLARPNQSTSGFQAGRGPLRPATAR